MKKKGRWTCNNNKNVYENTEVDKKENEWVVQKHNQGMDLFNKRRSRSNEAIGS
jgi:hypothetical protein